MLYLAKVHKQKKLFQETKTELRLLACKRGENNWSAIPEEVIAAPQAARFNTDVLVMVEITAQKKVVSVQEAASSLVRILQNFTRLQEKWQQKDQDREYWKRSLIQQASELNRREMEVQLQQEELEKQRLELERLRQTIEMEKKRRVNRENFQQSPMKQRGNVVMSEENKVVRLLRENSDIPTLVLHSESC
jgi:hypothetical protein